MFLFTLTLTLTGCTILYKTPEYNFAGRPIPPSKMLQRVLATYTNGGFAGGAVMLDGLRDLRGNIQNTRPNWPISGFSASEPTTILNFPEETRGYVLSATAGSLLGINYSTEASSGTAAGFAANPASVAAAADGSLFAAASEQTGQLFVTAGGTTYALNLPGVYRVAVNQGVSIVLAMVRNPKPGACNAANPGACSLYRVVQLPASTTPVVPPGSVDCEPQLVPVFCVVPVPGTYDHPINATFSLDGNSVYVLNCGPECGGTTASLSILQAGPLLAQQVPTVNPLDPSAPSPLASIGVPNPIPIPGGATVALSSGTTLYVAGQSLYSLSNGALNNTPRADGLFTGYLTAVNLSNYSVSQPLSISDGTHTKLLFADDNTLWAGSQQCASGERAAIAARELASTGITDQAGNYNCLTMVNIGTSTPTAQIIPAVVQDPADASKQVTVPNVNSNQNLYYYGDLTGLCWVQEFHKVFTAYGGQVHAFYTGGPIVDLNDPAHGTTPAAGTELNNFNFTVQGTVLDVAYMDALTNAAN